MSYVIILFELNNYMIFFISIWNFGFRLGYA